MIESGLKRLIMSKNLFIVALEIKKISKQDDKSREFGYINHTISLKKN